MTHDGDFIMSRDKQAVDVMDATGAKYMVALQKVEKERKRGTINLYMAKVDEVLEDIDEGKVSFEELCIHCLMKKHSHTKCL